MKRPTIVIAGGVLALATALTGCNGSDDEPAESPTPSEMMSESMQSPTPDAMESEDSMEPDAMESEDAMEGDGN